MLLFNLLVVQFSQSICLFSHEKLFFFLSICTGKHSRLATAGLVGGLALLSIFVLCTALLILDPIIYYLNPSTETGNLHKHSLYVYVNNTRRYQPLEKTKKKVCDEKKKRASIPMPWLLQQMISEKSVPQPSVLVALPVKLGVSSTEINIVFSALSIYLSSGCID